MQSAVLKYHFASWPTAVPTSAGRSGMGWEGWGGEISASESTELRASGSSELRSFVVGRKESLKAIPFI